MTHVEAVFELAEVLRQMLAAHMDVRSLDAELEPRPKAFQRVHVVLALGVFAQRVGD